MLGTPWRVAFTGFAPGFGYLTGGDPRLAVPRRASPRAEVPAGAVGLAGEYSGVYPRASPSGWQLIGRTDAELWNTERDPPAALLRPGTVVRFRAVPALRARRPRPPQPTRQPQGRVPQGPRRTVVRYPTPDKRARRADHHRHPAGHLLSGRGSRQVRVRGARCRSIRGRRSRRGPSGQPDRRQPGGRGRPRAHPGAGRGTGRRRPAGRGDRGTGRGRRGRGTGPPRRADRAVRRRDPDDRASSRRVALLPVGSRRHRSPERVGESVHRSADRPRSPAGPPGRRTGRRGGPVGHAAARRAFAGPWGFAGRRGRDPGFGRHPTRRPSRSFPARRPTGSRAD